jgi:hypothetical protein
MDIAYYFIGLLTGVSVSTFFIGKELYKYYTKYTIQQKKLDRILKLNDKLKRLNDFNSEHAHNLNAGY